MPKQQILMIEDDEEMIALGELILTKEGYEVHWATSGTTGLEILHNHSIDLVLLDIMMDSMDGWQVLESIKSDPQLAHIPVVMLTARHYLEDEQATAAHQGQYASYLVKPFIVHELIDEVRKVLKV